MVKSSKVSGFYKLSREERVNKLMEVTGLGEEDLGPLIDPCKVDLEVLDHMIENVVGSMTIPLGIATNFKVNGQDYLIPMAIEEPSVVAAASNAARMARDLGGFTATDTGPHMIAQIQTVEVPTPFAAKDKIL
jgi:hydroxymethylglutaryl-CoA reductase